MLTRFLTLINDEIKTSIVVDVFSSKNIEVPTGVDEIKYNELLKNNPPGTKIPLSQFPYLYTTFLQVISSNGQKLMFDPNVIQINYDDKIDDVENYLANVDENNIIVKHSKYIYSKKKLATNPLFEEEYFIIPG